jgi:hypothetical protein
VLPDYLLKLVFDDGMSGIVDLWGLVGKEVFDFWQGQNTFVQVQIGSSGELVRDSRVDLCPDSLNLKVAGQKPEDLFPALRHGPTHA